MSQGEGDAGEFRRLRHRQAVWRLSLSRNKVVQMSGARSIQSLWIKPSGHQELASLAIDSTMTCLEKASAFDMGVLTLASSASYCACFAYM